ncbi:MAG: TonB family protein [Myxococcota bacterium]
MVVGSARRRQAHAAQLGRQDGDLLGLALPTRMQQPTPKPQRIVRVRVLPTASATAAKANPLPRKQAAASPPVAKKKAKQQTKKPSAKSTKRAATAASPKKTTKRKQTASRQTAANSYQKALSRLDSVVGSQSPSAKQQQQQLADQLNQEIKQDYAQRVQALIQSGYRLPNVLSAFEKSHLHVVVRLFIDPQGNLLQAKIDKPSQNAVFDQAVMQGAKQTAPFGAPPKHHADYYRTQGIALEFCPTACANQSS